MLSCHCAHLCKRSVTPPPAQGPPPLGDEAAIVVAGIAIPPPQYTLADVGAAHHALGLAPRVVDKGVSWSDCPVKRGGRRWGGQQPKVPSNARDDDQQEGCGREMGNSFPAREGWVSAIGKVNPRNYFSPEPHGRHKANSKENTWDKNSSSFQVTCLSVILQRTPGLPFACGDCPLAAH